MVPLITIDRAGPPEPGGLVTRKGRMQDGWGSGDQGADSLEAPRPGVQ
jgi:hypothetical protein